MIFFSEEGCCIIFLRSYVLSVYLRKYVGQTAKLTKIVISKTGSTPILSPKSTIKGPHMAPNSPKTSVIPTAVDWISTENT